MPYMSFFCLAAVNMEKKVVRLLGIINENLMSLTAVQQDIYFQQLHSYKSAMYNVGGYLKLPNVDVIRIQQAHRRLVTENELFGLRIHATETGPRQWIAVRRDSDLKVVDFSTETDPALAAKAWLEALFREVIPLENTSLFRAFLVKLSHQEHWYVGVAHHLMMDGWGFANWAKTLGALYGASSAVEFEQKISWATVVAEDEAYLVSDKYGKDREFWLGFMLLPEKRLFEPLLRLKPPAEFGVKSQREVLPIHAAQFEGLSDLATGLGVSISQVFLGLVAVLLGVVKDHTTLVFGLPVHNRRGRAQKRMLGVFTSMSPFVVKLHSAGDFAQLVKQIAFDQKKCYRHQRYPIGHLATDLGISGKGKGLYEICFNYLRMESRFEIDGNPISLHYQSNFQEPTPLTLTLWEDAGLDEVQLQADFNLEYLAKEDIRDLFQRFQVLAEKVLENPHLGLKDLSLVLPHELERLAEWNATYSDLGESRSLDEVFQDRVRRHPDRVALIHGKVFTTYSALDQHSDRIAQYLRSLKVKGGEGIGLCLDRGPDMLAGILGILKAGAAYVPLDPGYPLARLQTVMASCEMAWVLTHAAIAERVGIPAGRAICLDQERHFQISHDQPFIEVNTPNPDQCAYFIFTSGSTGIPKGVAITHRNAFAMIDWARNTYSKEELSFVCACTSLNFDLSVFELFVPLSQGTTCVLVEDALELLNHGHLPPITLLNTVPSAINLLLDKGGIPASVKTVNLAGEPLAMQTVNRLLRETAAVRVYNLYGPSEDTTYSTFACFTKPILAEPPIGRPISNTQAFVMSQRMTLTPIGQVGELYLGGLGLAMGYWKRPGWTAERFVPHPEVSGQRLYRTGDVVRWSSGGQLEYLGRTDDQVKLRGFRIELQEIKSILLQNLLVKDAAVLVQGAGEARILTAYLVFHQEEAYPITEEQVREKVETLRASLARQLPAYMVPGAFIHLPRLPLTPNGKLDKTALPLPNFHPDGAFVAPRTSTEWRLAEIWGKFLHLEQVSVVSNFFEVGGHSILAIRLLSEISRQFGEIVPIASFFQNPTIEALAGFLDGHGSAPYKPIPRANPSEPLIASFAQKRLWFLEQLENGHYNMPAVLSLIGRPDPVTVQKTLDALVERHQVLRTTYRAEKDDVYQVLRPPRSLDLNTLDLSSESAESREVKFRKLALEEAGKPFDLGRDLMLRCRLVKLQPQEYRLLLTMHHIASDGWSVQILIREFAELYRAFFEARPTKLAPLPLQYADVAVWQRDPMHAPLFKVQLEFWKKRLEKLPPVHQLPLDFPREARRRSVGARFCQVLSSELSEALRQFARERGTTLFTLLQSAFALLQGRLSQQADVVMGTPVAGRNRKELEPLVGCFVNTVVLRTDLTGNVTFSQLLDRVNRASREDLAHQDLPFEILVDVLRPPRNLGQAPLFQILFTLELETPVFPELPDMEVQVCQTESGPPKFDLEIAVDNAGSCLKIEWSFDEALFKATSVARMAAVYEHLLEGVLQDSHLPIEDYSLVTPTDWQTQLRWSSQRQEFPEERCLFEEVSDLASRWPQRLAAVYLGDTLSFAQLVTRSEQLAAFLLAQGLKPDQLVGLCVKPSLDLLIAIFGIWRAGGAYLPLDPGFPASRLEYMLEDAGAKFILTQEALGEVLPAGLDRVFCLDSADFRHSLQDSAAPTPGIFPRPSPQSMAYVIYTSGSSGKPKGVMIQHQNLTHLSQAISHLMAIDETGPAVNWAWVSTYSFDASLEPVSQLAKGVTLHLLPERLSRQPEALLGYVRENNITHLDCTSVQFRTWMELDPGASLPNLITGGETLGQDLWEKAVALHTRHGQRIINAYGPTETCVDAVVCQITAERDRENLGKFLGNVYGYVFDEKLHLLPSGVLGELNIGGPGLARGYLNRPGLTASKFIPDPYSSIPGSRLYRSGDLVRWNPEGDLEFMGRIDGQVKIRGIRIELGEIEARLGELAGVNLALAAVFDDGAGEKKLAAYLHLKPLFTWQGQEITHLQGDHRQQYVESAKRELRQQLPDAMVPSYFVFLEQFPLTPTGKLDRKALPKPGESDLAKAVYAAPRTASEHALCAVWQEVMKLERIGIDDNFFDLGGHSLMATRMASAVGEIFRKSILVRSVFEYPTVRQLAQYLDSGSHDAFLAIPRANRHDVLPLSFSQQRLWFIDQLQGGSPEYNMPATFHLEGDLNIKALQAALNTLVIRHEVLRTTFASQSNQARQIIHPPTAVPLSVIDISGVHMSHPTWFWEHLLNQEAVLSFNLASDCMVRCRLVRFERQQHWLLFTIHHIASDGWSVGLILREISLLYQAFALGEQNPLPALSIQYADFASWQREMLQGEVLQSGIAFWRGFLQDAPQLHSLPLDFSRPAQASFQAEFLIQNLDSDVTSELKRLAKTQEVTLFMVLHCAFAVLIGRYSNEKDIVIGTPTAGRHHPALHPIIGFFVNTLVLRTQVQDSLEFAQLLQQSKQSTLAAFAHQTVPFEMLVEALQPTRSLSHAALFQIMLVLQDLGDEDLDRADLQLTGLETHQLAQSTRLAKFDLELNVSESDAGLRLEWQFAKELWNSASIARMAESFGLLLRVIAANPSLPVGRLPLLSPGMQERLLTLGSGFSNPMGRNQSVLAMLEAQAVKTPQSPAVRCGAQQLTYAELHAEANRVAHFLISKGVGSGTLVGLWMSPAPELMVGWLAVLKTGAAYVPLDVKTQTHRIGEIADECGMEFLLTQKSFASACAALDLEKIYLDSPDSPWRAFTHASPGKGSQPTDLAYVIFTSGSTGKPKGVPIQHSGLVDYCVFALGSYYPNPGLDSLLVTSVAFDISVPSLYLPLLTGACVALLPPGDVLEELALALFDPACPAYLLRMTPMHAKGMLHLSRKATSTAAHVFVIGGETLPVGLAKALQLRFPQSQIYNHFGPTETVVGCCYFDVSAHLAELSSVVPIGKPMENTTLLVLNEHQQLQPLGVPGELYIGGAGVAPGYLNDPDLSAFKFVTNPFQPGEKLFRTGDLVRWLPSGDLVFMQRLDTMVKLRGLRLDLNEVTARILEFPGVETAVAIVHGEEANQRLVAYLTGLVGSESEGWWKPIHNHLLKVLPDYMVPQSWVQLENLPLNPSGKVNFKALPEPIWDEGDSYVEPVGEIECRLTGLWREILRLEKVSATANFFDMGGHSLLATRLMSEIASTFGKTPPLRSLFEHPTIRRFAAFLQEWEGGSFHSIPKAANQDSCLASFAQQRMWFIHQLEQGSAQYHMPTAFTLSGSLNYAALTEALQQVIARHEVLRTHFISRDGNLFQIVCPVRPLVLPVVDLRNQSPEHQDRELAELVQAEFGRAFDLAKDLMIRFRLFHLAQEKYVLAITLHHIAADGWSIKILMNEMIELYAARCEGRRDRLTPLPIQYRDYAQWQREQLRGDAFADQLQFWSGQLTNLPQTHSLPLDFPRPALQKYQGDMVEWKLSAELSHSLRALASQQQVTLFILLQTAFALLLARYSRESDQVMGTPIAGRTHKDLDNLIGFFVNTLVLRTSLVGNPVFSQLLQHNKQTILDAFAHQLFPFENLVEHLKPDRSLSHAPLFQIMFAYRNVERPRFEGSDLDIERMPLAQVVNKFDLELTVDEDGDALLTQWVFDTALFSRQSVVGMAGSFDLLLQGITEKPHQRILSYPMTIAADWQRQRQWGEAPMLPLEPGCMHQWFEAQVAQYPDRTCIMDRTGHLEYRELNRRANQIAHYLIQAGVTPEALVGLSMTRSADMVAGILAIWKAGGAYVPLDPEYPTARLAQMVSESKVRWILTETDLVNRLPQSEAEPVCLDVCSLFESLSQENPVVEGLSSQQRAYVIYTSGSTGIPKGVEICHGNALALIHWARQEYSAADLQSVLASTSLNFDLSVFEMWMPLASGGHLVIVDNLLTLLNQPLPAEISLLNTVPSAMKVLLDQQAVPASVKVINLAGEALPQTLVNRLLQETGVERVYNLYGPSEDTTYSSFTKFTSPINQPPAIGKPIAGSCAYVLNADLEPLPTGAIGELYLGGMGLARGYCERPAWTAARFVANPFQPGERLYRTGDLVRWTNDGDLLFLGRVDDQVKLRGFRIELAEITSQLLNQEGVADAWVLVRGSGERQILTAYLAFHDGLVPEDESPLQRVNQRLQQLRTSLGRILPDFMVPAVFVCLSSLPHTPNGKIDKKALPDPDLGALKACVPPQTPTETRLVEIWKRVLELDEVSVATSFFELGGHSLLATRIMSEVGESLGKLLPLKTLFQHSSIRQFATYLDGLDQTLQPSISKADRSDELLASFAQQRLWFIDQLSDRKAQYNLPVAMRFTGTLDHTALNRSLNALVQRHEALRTSFLEIEGEVYQKVQAPAPMAVAELDWSGLEPAMQEEHLALLLQNEAALPFDLASDRMIRCQLIRLDRDHGVLLVSLHHIAADGWSIALLTEEFAALYAADVAGEVPNLPELPIQYADYSVWQRREMAEGRLKAGLAYWEKRLAGIPQLHSLPPDGERSDHRVADHQSLVITLGKARTRHLQQLATEQEATLFMVLQTTFCLLLGRWSHSSDIVLGTPVAGRQRKELESLIGLFVNTLVLRADLSGNPTYRQLLARMKKFILEDFDNQDVPFELLVEALQPVRSLSHAPIFQILFALQNHPQKNLVLPDLTLEVLEQAIHLNKFELALTVYERESGLEIRWAFDQGLFHRETISRLGASYVQLLDGVLENPDRQISRYALICSRDVSLLKEWNETTKPIPGMLCFHELVEAQSRRDPQRVAIQFEQQKMTYAELDARANQLARYLLEMGVKPDQRVGLCLARSTDLLLGILAILKSGAAYVPLDPSYPPARLAYMLEDAGVTILVGHGEFTQAFRSQVPAIVNLDDQNLQQALERQSTTCIDKQRLGLTSDHLAYAIYTSGSTGRPKGVAITHRSLVNLTFALGDVFQVGTEGMRWAWSSTFSFDASLKPITQLAFGVTLHLLSEEERMQPALLAATIRDQKIDILDSTPTQVKSWIDTLPDSQLPGLILGGETLGTHLWRKLGNLSVGSSRHFINVYGPTEACVDTTLCQISQTCPRESLGSFLPNVYGYVLDEHLNRVPVGMAGELCIGGVGLARGYLNRPDLTSTCFIPDPYARVGGSRIYRTGDLARFKPDGTLEYLGRIDHQVKVRGIRVELGEIQARLLEVDHVADSVVVAGSGPNGETQLVAYLVLHPEFLASEGVNDNDASWRRHWIQTVKAGLEKSLPKAMVPGFFILLAKLPLTPSGKLDRAALPAPEEGDLSKTTYQAPQTQIQQTICEIWQDLLGLTRLGIEDGFFEVGGHSLLATRAASALSKKLGKTIPVRAIFEHPTVRQLADYLRDSGLTDFEFIPKADPAAPLALSFSQRRLWFIDQLQPGSPQYHIPAALEVLGPLDAQILQKVLTQIVARHEVLRTTYHRQDPEVFQKVHPVAQVPLTLLELGEEVKSQQPETVALLIQQEAKIPFDLTRDLMLRCRLVRLPSATHILLLTLHHIAADGWSMDILLKEFEALYREHTESRPALLPALSIQYADFANWQQVQSKQQAFKEGITFWKKRLAALPQIHNLPLDHVRPSQQRFAAGSVRRFLSDGEWQSVRQFARHQDVTPFMVLQSVFAVLLSRLSWSQDLVMGTPVSGRSHPEVEPLIGFFVNTLVLRANVAGNPRFSDFLKKNREDIVAGFAHQDIPFETLVEVLQPSRSLSHAPLFQILFTYQHATTSQIQLPGLSILPVEQDRVVNKFDLELTAIETPEGLQLHWVYDRFLWEPASVARMADGFAHLLDMFAAQPNRRVQDIPLVNQRDLRQLQAWNPTPTEALPSLCIHEMFMEWVRKEPHRVAVVDAAGSVSFDQLNARANQIASRLLKMGVVSGQLVGLCTSRGRDMVASILGIWKVGAAYVPLDPGYPAARIQHMLGESAAQYVLTEREIAKHLAILAEKALLLDDQSLAESEITEPKGTFGSNPGQVAYVIYTSGSTGIPKGVKISHSNAGALIYWAGQTYSLSELAITLASTSLNFDLSIFELFVPLAWGQSCVVVADALALLEPGFNIPITLLNTVPSAMKALLDRGGVPASVQVVNLAGEPLPLELANRVFRETSCRKLFNLYGPSEDTTYSTFACFQEELTQVPAIGKPIDHSQAFVLSEGLALQPVGAIGELYLAGKGVAFGYHGRPGWTAERFVPNPFNVGKRLYKTGDLVRRREDGSLVFLGRTDDQIKLRGYRIELDEITTQLLRCSDVQDAVTVVRQKGDAQLLIAYLVFHDGATENTSDRIGAIRAELLANLPEYMVPAVCLPLKKLPLTANGKIDKRALPDPFSIAQTTYVPAKTVTETKITIIWQKLLQQEQISADANFFELGGHSLVAVQVVGELARQMAKAIPLQALFEHPELRSFAAYLDAQPTTEYRLIEKVPRDRRLPASFSQQRLWVIDQLGGGSIQYNMPAALKLVGKLDVQALQASLNGLVERHEVIRTTLASDEEGVFQKVHSGKRIALPLIDLSHIASGTQQNILDELARAELNTPFHLATDLMVRCHLVKMSQLSHVLLFTMHHLASDGWTIGILVQEMAAFYKAFVRDQPPSLEPLPIQYADYAVWQRQRLNQTVLNQMLAYWKNQLAGLPQIHQLPLDHPRPVQPRFSSGVHHQNLGMQLSLDLKQLALQHDVTQFVLLHTAFAVLLGRWSNTRDIVVGAPVAGRERQELERLVGFFVNTLVLRTKLSGSPSFVEVLSRSRTTILEALAHQALPFEVLVEALHPDRSLGHSPLFQITFAFQKDPQRTLSLPQVVVEPLEKQTMARKFDLELTLTESETGLRAIWLYDPALFEASTIARMASSFEVLLREIAVNPHGDIDHYCLNDAKDLQLLESWNPPQPELPEIQVHQQFEAWAAKAPDQIAIHFSGNSLTYRSLEERANQLAHYLRRMGVGPETLVGLFVPRSVEMMVGILAILKAGGAYVPLDPDYPKTRLEFMVQDCGIEVVLGHSSLENQLPSNQAKVIWLDSDGDHLKESCDVPPVTGLTSNHLAYVIYTSGSTGTPKGVMVSHGNILRLISPTNYVTFEPGDVIGQASNCAFDAATFEIWGALCNGLSLHYISRETMLDPQALSQALACGCVTTLFVTTVVFNQMASVKPDGFHNLKHLMFGGEMVDVQAVNRVLAHGKPKHLQHVYGPTENTTFSTHFQIGPHAAEQFPIGRAISGTSAFVLDAKMQLQIPGVVGELYLGGPGLARGYGNRPSLTADRFVPSPFESGGRLYRSGDLVRWLATGQLVFIDRADEQVKLRGFRIELGEITARLLEHPGVASALVTVRGKGSEKLLVAYVVFAAGKDVAASSHTAGVATSGLPFAQAPVDALREHLRLNLPDYMIPSAFVALESMPVTPNGKIDRKALPDPSEADFLRIAYIPPGNEVEADLCLIWQELLGVERVGLADNFFDLGGHSLLITRLAARIAEVFQVGISLQEAFTTQNLGELANLIEVQMREKDQLQKLQSRSGEGDRESLTI